MLIYKCKILFLYLAKIMGLFRFSRRLTQNSLRILCYHNFGTGDEIAWHPKLFIAPGTFRERMEYLKKQGYTVLPLETAVRAIEKGSLPRASVVITIDDGWYGIMDYAHPILAKMKFPYTIYVTSYYSKIDLPVFNLIIPFLFFKTSKQKVDFSTLQIPGINRVDLMQEKLKQSAVNRIVDYGEKSNVDIKQDLIYKISTLLEIDLKGIIRKKTFHIMSPGELEELCDQGVDLQLHTHRHQWPMEKGKALEELELNRQFLSSIQAGNVKHFCYPSGAYTDEQFAYLKTAAVKTAVTCEPGLNNTSTNRFALKRFLDGENISRIEFEAELSGLLELMRMVRNKIKRNMKR